MNTIEQHDTHNIRMQSIELVGSVMAFLVDRGEVVLQHRDENIPHSPGMLSGFGGAIEPEDQTTLHAMRRELGEELEGLHLSTPLIPVGEIPFELRTDCNARGPLYLFTAILSHSRLRVLEGQGSVRVPITGIDQWVAPVIAEDARNGLDTLRRHINLRPHW